MSRVSEVLLHCRHSCQRRIARNRLPCPWRHNSLSRSIQAFSTCLSTKRNSYNLCSLGGNEPRESLRNFGRAVLPHKLIAAGLLLGMTSWWAERENNKAHDLPILVRGKSRDSHQTINCLSRVTLRPIQIAEREARQYRPGQTRVPPC
jgi:hypothetical protein